MINYFFYFAARTVEQKYTLSLLPSHATRSCTSSSSRNCEVPSSKILQSEALLSGISNRPVIAHNHLKTRSKTIRDFFYARVVYISPHFLPIVPHASLFETTQEAHSKQQVLSS